MSVYLIMIEYLWFYLLNFPNSPIPYPWERFFDLQDQVVYYYNTVDGTFVYDLRDEVDLGGCLVRIDNMWRNSIRYCAVSHHPQCPFYDVRTPILVQATCCGQSVYIISPDMLRLCPFCGDNVNM